MASSSDPATVPSSVALPSTSVTSLLVEQTLQPETQSTTEAGSSAPSDPTGIGTSEETPSPQDNESRLAKTDPGLGAGSEGGSKVESDDNVSETSQKSDSSNPPRFSFGDRNLKSVARELRLNQVDWGHMPQSSQLEQTTNFVEHLRSMNWMYETLTNFNRRAPPSSTSSREYRERIPKVPQLRYSTWLEWRLSEGDHAVEVLVEEEPSETDFSMPFPPPRQRSQPFSDEGTIDLKSVVLQPRVDGVKVLPDRIRINSLPVLRTLATLTKGSISGEMKATIYRPFKILHWLEPNLRQRQSEIQVLYKNKCESLSETVDEQVPLGAEDNAPEGPDLVAKPPMDQYERDDIIFTSGYDWKFLSLSELREADMDLGVVLSFIDEYISPLSRALQRTGDFQIHYQELWHVFKPGTIVYVKDPTIPQKLWRVVQGRGGQRPLIRRSGYRNTHFQLGGASDDTKPPAFVADCYHLDFDGSKFIRVFKQFRFEWFRELSSVRSLPIVPASIAEQDGLVNLADCRRRGKDFISYTKWSYSYYRGQSLISEPDGTGLRRPERRAITSVVAISEAIESPVVVDFHRCVQEIPDWKPGRLSTSIWRRTENVAPEKPPENGVHIVHPPPGADDDRLWDIRIAEDVLSYTDQSKPPEVYGREPPEDDEIMLLPDRVFAFVLRTRQWACIPLGSPTPETRGQGLTKMFEDEHAWKYLQIDDGHRTIIKSLMATHFRKKKSERRQFDIIQDKGKGLIVLLHGVPGVGKTSTAETVAAYYNKPLLPITCGDLGITPTEVEANLQAAFQMAQAWECVLLLDEADVFLAERSQNNISRNALVSVFLRVMEYYEGILFLTTNKVGSFDEAFKSRMSMALYYPPLTQEQTTKIWEALMDRTEELSVKAAPGDPSQQVKFNRDEIKSLYTTLWTLQTTKDDHKPVWNGRQIRNAFQTAVALAEFHQQENKIPGRIIVKGEHFEKVATVSHEFNAYLYSVRHERLENDLAHTKEHRFDDFNRYQFGLGGQRLDMAQQGGLHQGYGVSGHFQNPQQFGMAGMGVQNMGMAGLGFSNPQNQGNFMASQPLQAGFSNMNNVGMSNNTIGNIGLGNAGLGMSGSNAVMGAQQNNTTSAGIPGQSLGGQLSPQQQQQLQELLRLQQQQQQ